MRTILKPAIPCAAMASSHCRQGLPGLEGLRRRDHLQAGDLQGTAGEHRAVPQRRAPHAGGPPRHSQLPHQRRLHRRSHLPTDPASPLHHRPHRAAVPGGNSFSYVSTTATTACPWSCSCPGRRSSWTIYTTWPIGRASSPAARGQKSSPPGRWRAMRRSGPIGWPRTTSTPRATARQWRPAAASS